MSSGWLSRNRYLIRMSYDNVIMSSGWHRLPFVSHPDEIVNFDFPHHAVALQRFRTDPPKPRVRVMWHFAVVSMGVSNEPCECLTYSRSFSAAVFTNWIKKILCQVDTWNPGWMKLRLSWISSAPHTVTWMVNVFVHACSLVLMLQLGILPSKHLNHKQISGTYRSLLVMFASCFM